MITISVCSLITKLTPCKLTFLPTVCLIYCCFAPVNIFMKLPTVSVIPACSIDARSNSRGVDFLCILKTDPGGRGGGFIWNNVTFGTSSHTLVGRYHDPWISSVSPVWHSSMDVYLLSEVFKNKMPWTHSWRHESLCLCYLLSDVDLYIHWYEKWCCVFPVHTIKACGEWR
jgi:hypothetical protein